MRCPVGDIWAKAEGGIPLEQEPVSFTVHAVTFFFRVLDGRRVIRQPKSPRPASDVLLVWSRAVIDSFFTDCVTLSTSTLDGQMLAIEIDNLMQGVASIRRRGGWRPGMQ